MTHALTQLDKQTRFATSIDRLKTAMEQANKQATGGQHSFQYYPELTVEALGQADGTQPANIPDPETVQVKPPGASSNVNNLQAAVARLRQVMNPGL